MPSFQGLARKKKCREDANIDEGWFSAIIEQLSFSVNITACYIGKVQMLLMYTIVVINVLYIAINV
jgi:hypothetical protein